MATIKFPKNFLWGAATASHQVEGDTSNDWSLWEKENATRLASESEEKFRFNPHWKKFKTEATNPDNYISGKAADHYHRFREDFDLAKSLHHNAHRFSLEWSRIEPEKGKFDEAALAHYRDVIHALRERNIEPFVTLWHWTLPLWLAEEGGILSPKFPELFARYAEKVVATLGDEVTFWITLNEPDVVSSHAYLKGAWPPQKKSLSLGFRAWHVLADAHKKAYRVIKKTLPSAQVGIAKHQVYFEMARPTILNRILRFFANQLWNHYFFSLIRDSQDFIGLNHYNRNVINNGFGKNPNAVQTDFGWEYWPESLYHALVELQPYKKPIYITENGIADTSDELRKQFIPAALTAVHRAIEAGADVRGYFYWSLLDNFEWDKGFWPRFGLIAIDYATQTRTVRPSALAYAKICKENTLDGENI